MQTIRINESQLRMLISNVITEQPDEKMPGQIERFGYKSNDPKSLGTALKKQENFFQGVNKSINMFIDSFGITKCVPLNMKPFVVHVMTNKQNIMSKLGITDKELVMFLKASIGIMGRETSFTQLFHFDGGPLLTPRYLKKNIYNFLGDYKWFRDKKLGGKTGSYGPAQIQKGTWNSLNMQQLFGMQENQLYTIIGAGMGTIVNLSNNYKNAKTAGYSSSRATNTPGTGNGALDIAIAGHNIGKPVKWCKTNDKNYAAPCDSKDHKYRPYPKTQPNLVLTVLPQEIPNYIPNKKTEKYQGDYENVPLTTHGYVKEVAGYMSSYGCLDGILSIK